MAGWKRGEQVAFLRMVDVVTGLLVAPAGRGAAGRLVAERLLGSAFELLGGEDSQEEAEHAGRYLARLTPADTVDEPAVRSWLREALRERAREANERLWEGDWGHIDLREHDVWTLLELSPFSRRLRVWTATTRIGATALGAAIGVGAHQIGHWGTGRSRPSAADRIALAGALGVDPAWLAADRDHSADSDLYLYRACPCGSPAALVPGEAEHSAYRGAGVEEVGVSWCSGCGQAHAAVGASGLIPLPLTQATVFPDRYPNYRAACAGRGSELDRAWPHALWCPGPDTAERGPVRVSPLLTVPPFTPPVPAPPADPRPGAAFRRQPLGGGQVPRAGVERTGVQRIQALLLWVGRGRRLTEKGLLKLADARLLVEALPSGDQWDPVELGYQYSTRSSAELPHLLRLLAWCTASGLLKVDRDVLAPTGDHGDLCSDLPALTRFLTGALPRMALYELDQFRTLTPLSLPDDLALALAVLWQVLRDAPGPIAPVVIEDAIWDDLTDGGNTPFQEPKEAETAVRRDVRHLLVLIQDLDLVAAVGGLLQLTATARRSKLPTR